MTEPRLTPRQRARLATIDEIKRVARTQLTTEGSAGLSLRAIARELGVVSSAVYRYVPSRDELVTMLIEEAYDALGAAVEAAEAAVRRDDHLGRWLAVGRAVRRWALEHPADYALVYGSPIPGYHAPPERTIEPATRVPRVLIGLLADLGSVLGDSISNRPASTVAATPFGSSAGLPLPRSLVRELRAITETLHTPVPPDLMARGLLAWLAMFGMVSFELFGQLNNVIEHLDTHFDHQMRRLALMVGFGAA